MTTVAYLNWGGISNGLLLEKAAESGFDVLITNDRGLEYEQNLGSLSLSVVVLLAPSNTIESIRRLLGDLADCLATLRPKSFAKVGMAQF